MGTFHRPLLLVAALLAAPVVAQDAPPPPEQTAPPTPAPKDPPPPPPRERPAPPATSSDRDRDRDGGQWVYTEQHGWVWMPYGEDCIHESDDGGPPHMYLYTQDVGWCWVLAPWLWGWGPRPWFGPVGYHRYVWWGVGVGRWYGFRGHPGGWGHRGVWRGGPWTGGHGLSRPAVPGWRSTPPSPRGRGGGTFHGSHGAWSPGSPGRSWSGARGGRHR
ncbi:MAG: hypothetical protein U0P81_01295 [Holophagaceae bacterium]